ncbi:carbohydrate binding domain-containing protein [Streptomyces sp. NRRL F-2664]|uniref:carbohydrate binding domain-containing protein n=1 Tax=Streptomyces sp. NRRL F-2664 TaxID=1463842 RepID=UPI0004C630E7|nr:carbohydrate binding domain-containing protein [Streptomyces sp. NRRL F-2664]
MTIKPVLRVAFGFAPMATSVNWTDISQWVDLASGIRCTRGAADELTQTQPSTMSLTLDNTDGRFSAGLATSPYYPYVRPGCPIQLGIVTLAGKNHIRTPGFEGGSMDGWSNSATSPAFAVVPSTTRAHSGTYSLNVAWQNTGTGGVVEQTVYGLDVGVTYTLSGWVWVPTGDPAVRWLIDGGSPGTASAVTNAWTQITKTFVATSTSHTVQLTTNVTSPLALDTVWLDDVQLEVGASAASFDSAGADLHWRFYGLVNQWDTEWITRQSKVLLTATDFFKNLSRQPQLDALLSEEIKQLNPVLYYPLTEPSTSVSAGDLGGTGAGSLVQAQVGTGGSVTFAEVPGPAATEVNVLQMAPAGASNGIRLDAYMGAYAEEQTTLTNVTFECWFQTSTVGRYFMAARSDSFQHEIVFGLNGSGYLIIEHTGAGGARTVSVVNATNLADGAWHHVVYDEFDQDVYIDGGAPITVSIVPMLALRYLSIGGYPDQLWAGAVAHAAIYTGNQTPALIAAHYDAGMTGYAGEDSDERILRLAGYAGVVAVDAVGDFSPVASQGRGGSSALELMRAVEATEGGRLASHRDGHALLFQSRTVRYSTPIALTLDFGDLETDGVQYAADDQKLVNQYKVTRPGGATQRVVAASSVTAFGPAPKEDTILTVTDAEALDAANWRVSRYATVEPELRELPIRAYAQSVATYRTLLDADISTLFAVTGLPAQAPASTVTARVEGYVETIGLESHLIQFHTSRGQTDAAWTLDSSTYSVLGSTTRLGY